MIQATDMMFLVISFNSLPALEQFFQFPHALVIIACVIRGDPKQFLCNIIFIENIENLNSQV